MIEELIEEGQYQVALSRLTDMDDEMTRYYRLVCLNALEDYQRCMQEGAVAKMQANNTYYEVTALYLNALKELEEYELPDADFDILIFPLPVRFRCGPVITASSISCKSLIDTLERRIPI